jgi:hypothetical protein
MSASTPTVIEDSMECPLCMGKGQLRRAEVLERLGMKDFARIAQLGAEEAFRLLLGKHKHDDALAWSRFETELNRRTSEIEGRHKAEVQKLQKETAAAQLQLDGVLKNQGTLLRNAKDSERLDVEKRLREEIRALETRIQELAAQTSVAEQHKELEVGRVRDELQMAIRTEQSDKKDLSRKVEDYLKEINTLRENNQNLQTELSKVARVGKREELDFAAEARTWPGIWVSDKLPKNGDYILAYRDPAGTALEPRILIDNKDKDSLVTDGDIEKLIRDARTRSIPVAALVTRNDSQLRQVDRELRWSANDSVWVLRTTRQWLPRDLDVLKPLFDRMHIEGPEFLEHNVLLADEIRRTFADIDAIEKDLKKASTAIRSASELVVRYRSRLQTLCDVSCTHRIALDPRQVSSAETETVLPTETDIRS